jgi:hypothetical protein
VPNDLNHGIHLFQHLIVPEPQYSISSRTQSLFAQAIMLILLMLATNDFDDQSSFQAHKSST